MTKKVKENMFECASIIEKNYLKGPWVLSQKFSVCDTYLALVTRWLPNDGVSLDNLPKLNAHDKLMRSRSSVQKVLTIYK